jgi:hypothetical protein
MVSPPPCSPGTLDDRLGSASTPGSPRSRRSWTPGSTTRTRSSPRPTATCSQAGGKRFRPLLTLLAAELGNGICRRSSSPRRPAVELTHLASLYHDDVMDEADTRRGVPERQREVRQLDAILVGDLLFGTASDIIADLGPEAVKIQAQTFIRLCSGQIRDDRPCPPAEDPHAYYLGRAGRQDRRAHRHGRPLRRDALRVLARGHRVLVTDYGERIGVAFQLADDLIDISSGASRLGHVETGKTPGTDLREGVAHPLRARAPRRIRYAGQVIICQPPGAWAHVLNADRVR